MPRRVLAGLMSVAVLALAAQLAGQSAPLDAETTARLLALPRATHHSEIREDYDASRDRTRVWINTNEDDSRLWSPQGAQMDMEFRVSAWVPGRGPARLPLAISVDFASLGDLRPADPPHALELRADGQVVTLTQQPDPDARSGALLFMTTRTTMALEDFARVAVAKRVDGRIWGRDFVLLDAQLEILRAYLARLIAPRG